MPIVKPLSFKGKDIEVRELTVLQLDTVLGSNGDMTMIDRVFNPDMVTSLMLEMSTGVSTEDMRSCSPSDLRPLVDAVKEVNKDFLAGMKSLVGR